MRRILKRAADRLYGLPAICVILICAGAGILLWACLSGLIVQPAVVYFSYLFSTLALIALCFKAARFYRGLPEGRGVVRLVPRGERFDPLRRLIEDFPRRTRLMQAVSFATNVAYALFKLILGFAMGSRWLIGAGVYYAILAGIHFSLARRLYLRREGPDLARDWKVYRRTAIQLLALTVVEMALVAQMVGERRAYNYPGVTIYAFALFAFIKVISTAINVLRRRKGDSRILAATYCVSFACALMSLLALQTSLISRFGGDDLRFAGIMNALTGAGVCAAMVVMCAYMLNRYRRWRSGAEYGIPKVKTR